MITKRSFTLLEMMIGLVLIALISGVIGVRMGGALEEKRFRASIERLSAELESCRRLALTGQVDWIAILEKKKGFFILQKSCPELGKDLTASWESNSAMQFNGKAANRLSFQFSSSGKVAPSGVLVFNEGKRFVSWKLPDQFSIVESDDVSREFSK